MEGFADVKRFIPDHAGDLAADSSSLAPLVTTTILPGPSGSQQSLQAGGGNAMDGSDAGDTGLKGQFSYQQSATLVPDGSPTPTIKTSFLTASSSSGSSVAAGVATSILTATTSPAITSSASASAGSGSGSTITGPQLIAAIFLPIFLVSILGLSAFLFFQARRRRKQRLHDISTDPTTAGFTNQPPTAKELCDYSPRSPNGSPHTTDFYNPAHTLNAFALSPSTTAPTGPFSHLPVYSAFSRHGSAGSLDFTGYHDPLMRQTRLSDAQANQSQQSYPTDPTAAAATAPTAAPPPPYMPRICTTPEGIPILQSAPSQPARLTEANLGHHRRASRGLPDRHAEDEDEDAVSEVSAGEHDFPRRRRGGLGVDGGDADMDADADGASVVSELSHTGRVPVVEHRIV